MVSPESIFDVQAKRIHEYKRQLLNALHIVHQYLRVTEDGNSLPVPRTWIFSGKAAPGYAIAKLIIKLINNLSMVINNDPRVNDQLKVVFLPDYRVSLAEKIIPAAEVSEQISTAGFEASGTGNMKFALNGALTVGTLDGANIEIREEVGDHNIYIFGLTTNEVQELSQPGAYDPWRYYHAAPMVQRVVDAIASGVFSQGDTELFQPLIDRLMSSEDPYLHLADFESYAQAQERAGQDYLDHASWQRKAILNVARTGKFSSDRTIQEYADDIWNLPRVTP